MPSVRLDGVVEGPRRFLTLQLFRKGHRVLALRCLTSQPQRRAPCREAIGALSFHARVENPAEDLRVLHLREERPAFTFDAPDDGWLADGPHHGPGGRDWAWYDDKKRCLILVVVETGRIPFASSKALAEDRAEVFRGKGFAVTIKESTLAGEPCHHLEMEKDGKAEDAFIQHRGDHAYLLYVMASARDPALLDQARAGLRIVEKGPASPK